MQEKSSEMLEKVRKRIQRCYGCFIAYHFKDMYLGEDVTFFCEHCKDETMFHFDEFSKFLDLDKSTRSGRSSSLKFSEENNT